MHSFEPVSADDLKLAHDAAYVDGVLNATLSNGFGNRDAEVAASLPYTTGSLLAAARHALVHHEAVCSPTSGFHHAGYADGGGFCTFNGLIVTAMKLKSEGLVDRVAIVDLDMHFGDGTAELIKQRRLHWVDHHTQGQHFFERADAGPDAKRYFRWLSKALDSARTADLVIYQAGADPHVRDPLGGLLTEQQMAQRDHDVFGACLGRPLVWNLAGGYQTDANGGIAPVLRLHRNTVVACQTVAARGACETVQGA